MCFSENSHCFLGLCYKPSEGKGAVRVTRAVGRRALVPAGGRFLMVGVGLGSSAEEEGNGLKGLHSTF